MKRTMKIFFYLLIVTTLVTIQHTAVFAQKKNNTFPKPKNGNTYVIAHRGVHIGIPENSLAAYQKAIDLGCDFVEIDARSTQDGHIVSVHNSTIDAYVEGATGKVNDFTLAELKKLDIGEKVGAEWKNTRIATFEEILQLCQGKIGIYLDLKEPLVEKILELIKKYNMEHDVLWCIPGSRMEAIIKVKELCEACIPMPDPGDEENLIPVLEKVRPKVVAPVMGDFSETYVGTAHKYGAKVFVDEDRGGEKEWEWILSFGTDGIQTDNPEALIRFIKERNLESERFENNKPTIDNGILTLKLDLSRGGAISWISATGSERNIVNIADEGRYIQQSYYAGKTMDRTAEGQAASWSPWSWNPIQVGDAFRNRAKILDFKKDKNSMYVKCIPMQWDMNNRPAEATMEQWTTLNGSILKVRNRLTCHRSDEIYGDSILRDQELPAVYPISALKNLYTYLGEKPFTNDSLTKPEVIKLSSGFWGRYKNISEHWMAFVDDNNWGMGVYNPLCNHFLAGMSGSPGKESKDGSTSYIAPIKKEILYKNCVYEYEYFIIIGMLDEIREKVYDLNSEIN